MRHPLPLWALALAISSPGCTTDIPPEPGSAGASEALHAASSPGAERSRETPVASPATPGDSEVRLERGTGPTRVALRDRGHETVAMGPSAVAVAPDGAVLLLDRLNGRVLTVDLERGTTRSFAATPEDAEDLAADAHGAVATFSPVRARAWLYGPGGEPAGELAVPRAFRQVQGIGLGASRQVALRTALQETFVIGSPAAPLPLATALGTHREGAAFLGDGTGVSVALRSGGATTGLRHGAPELVLQEPGVRGEAAPRVALDAEGVSSARVIGADGERVCVRLETVTSTPEVQVTREARCVEARTGQSVLRVTLPPPGLYVPRTELAMGAGKLVLLHPTAEGVTLRSWSTRLSPPQAPAEEVSP